MDAHSYPLNAWYAAAWGTEIEHALAKRTVCERELVLYRQSNGKVAALEDTCWHRLVPLSLGKLDGDRVICGYHGLEYDANGRCVHMPGQQTINPSACVRAYPVEERYRLLWVWMGDPALADPDKIPDFHWNDSPQLAGEGGTFYSLGCNYRLVVDNLMDLTHETFVHGGSIGHHAITSTPFQVDHTDTHVTVTRWMHNIEAPPFWARLLGRDVPVDRWHIISFEAPSIVSGNVGVCEAGTSADRSNTATGVEGYFLAAITPETETTCHYFWNFVRNRYLDDEEWTRYLNTAHHNDEKTGVYDQDVTVLEAQQRAISRHPRQPFFNLNIDAGPLWARRLIQAQVDAEQGHTAPHRTGLSPVKAVAG